MKTKEELVERYDELYHNMSTSSDVEKMKIFGRAEKDIFGRIAQAHQELACEWLSMIEAVEWCNYVTEDEAKELISKLKNQDDTMGAHWDYATMKSMAERKNVPIEEYPYFNSYALWVTMNMIYSDHNKSIRTFIDENSATMLIYHMAVEKLKDRDRKHFLRPYFNI